MPYDGGLDLNLQGKPTNEPKGPMVEDNLMDELEDMLDDRPKGSVQANRVGSQRSKLRSGTGNDQPPKSKSSIRWNQGQ